MGKSMCKKCSHMRPEFCRSGRNQFYCFHPEAKTECMPHRIIARSREPEIPTKTSPRWCPLRGEDGR